MPEVKSRPILYSTPMVQAYLASKKCETRRTRGLELINLFPNDWVLDREYPIEGTFYLRNDKRSIVRLIKCPWGKIGDELYGRETWATANKYDHLKPSEIDREAMRIYRKNDPLLRFGYGGKWRPSIHMPKEFSRIHQPITGLKCQRLWDMRERDAVAEGFTSLTEYGKYWNVLSSQKYPWSGNFWVFCLQYPKYEEYEAVKV